MRHLKCILARLHIFEHINAVEQLVGCVSVFHRAALQQFHCCATNWLHLVVAIEDIVVDRLCADKSGVVERAADHTCCKRFRCLEVFHHRFGEVVSLKPAVILV